MERTSPKLFPFCTHQLKTLDRCSSDTSVCPDVRKNCLSKLESSNCKTLSQGYFFILCRTYYYSAMNNVLNRRYKTNYRCCNGWQQLNGESGCMYRKYFTSVSSLKRILPKKSLSVHLLEPDFIRTSGVRCIHRVQILW